MLNFFKAIENEAFFVNIGPSTMTRDDILGRLDLYHWRFASIPYRICYLPYLTEDAGSIKEE